MVAAMRRLFILCAVVCTIGALPALAVASPTGLLWYTDSPAAVAGQAAGADLAPVQDSWRQYPADHRPAWPASRRIAKIDGRLLATLSAAQMRSAFREALAPGELSGYAAVDEIVRTRWSLQSIARLRAALMALTPDERARIAFYVGPSLVERVGRADPSAPLPTQMRRLVQTMSLAGATYLELYGGDGSPVSALDMARYPTRWQARWPAYRAQTLRLLFGPPRGVDMATIWLQARASEAGRALLANGVGVYGLRGAAEGEAFIAGYRAFLAGPTATPPQGDYDIPALDSIDIHATPIMRPGARVRVTFARAGRVVVVLRSPGRGDRTIAKFEVDDATTTHVTLPKDLRPGSYVFQVNHRADALLDQARATFRVAG